MREFRSIRIGEVFEVNGKMYRKVEAIPDLQRGYIKSNAINLAIGAAARFGAQALVTTLRVHAKRRYDPDAPKKDRKRKVRR